MAHVHGAAEAAKAASERAMMGGGMGKMMEMGEMMGNMGGMEMMANMPMPGKAAVAAAAAKPARSFLGRLARHPLLVFGLGLAAGYLVHKYRREIIAGVTRASEKSKDFVLQQKENLEDLVAECKECSDDSGEAGNT